MNNTRAWEILRNDMDTNKTEIYKMMHTDDEEIPKNFCKRFNAFANRNDFMTHYFYREKQK